MKYISFTYVDAKTGVPCLIAPTRNGPANPPVAGLLFGFALESRYPTSHPLFYGTCDDAADTAIPGVLAVIDQTEYDQALAAELNARRAVISCSPAQGRLALLQFGMLDALEAWVATQSRAVQIEYAARTVWQRTWPLVASAGSAMNLSDDQMDELFALAATL